MIRKSTFDKRCPEPLLNKGFSQILLTKITLSRAPRLALQQGNGRAPDMIATMLLETLDTARDLGRLNEIAGVLLHATALAMRCAGLVLLIVCSAPVMCSTGTPPISRASRPPVQVRLAMEELGPTFVKLGQVLAGRADLFGPEWIAEFESCTATCRRCRWTPSPAVAEDLGAEPEAVFARFEIEPLAAASIAQVHRAALADGTEVIVKIRRQASRPPSGPTCDCSPVSRRWRTLTRCRRSGPIARSSWCASWRVR